MEKELFVEDYNLLVKGASNAFPMQPILIDGSFSKVNAETGLIIIWI
ncbi:MAG: hypothetical protein WD059_02210 [Balneolaceae bacterium]